MTMAMTLVWKIMGFKQIIVSFEVMFNERIKKNAIDIFMGMSYYNGYLAWKYINYLNKKTREC